MVDAGGAMTYSQDVLDRLVPFREGFEGPNETNLRVIRLALRMRELAANETELLQEPDERRHRFDGIPSSVAPVGDLRLAFRTGLLEPGDAIVVEQKRKGTVHRGLITDTGSIRVDGKDYDGPSPALTAVGGSSINGWKYWVHERSGEILHDRRNKARVKLGLKPVVWKDPHAGPTE